MENSKTALELMKQRYEAYKNGDINYVKKTWDKKESKKINWNEIIEWNNSVEWKDLKIIRVERGDRLDRDGIVEFEAKYFDKETKEEKIHHEISYFLKKGRKWYYKGYLQE
ncbi:YchJ family metal-binding protein [Fusobacterium sp. MFO224]|uniref:YchJ family metal-binding protein n=1 Tax=Fusobacterium sp. MFO224 TaxID=3378070 RepID=UPI003852FF47